MANYASDMFTNGGTDTGIDALANWGKDRLNQNNNWHLGFVDVPHRLVGDVHLLTAVRQGESARRQEPRSPALVAGGWRIGGVTTIQSGFPLVLYGMNNSGSLNQRPDRIAGVEIELPKSMQHFYDGKTQITLSSGRTITPCSACFLKYNPEAFAGRTVTAGERNDGSRSLLVRQRRTRL